MENQKLFEQGLKSTVEDDHRIPVGKLNQFGADNILPADFFGTYFQFGRQVILPAGSSIIEFNKIQKSDNYAIFIRSYDGVGYEIISQTEEDFTIECLAPTTIDYLTILF